MEKQLLCTGEHLLVERSGKYKIRS